MGVHPVSSNSGIAYGKEDFICTHSFSVIIFLFSFLHYLQEFKVCGRAGAQNYKCNLMP